MYLSDFYLARKKMYLRPFACDENQLVLKLIQKNWLSQFNNQLNNKFNGNQLNNNQLNEVQFEIRSLLLSAI